MATAAFAPVVTIVQESITSPVGAVQFSHNPAIPNIAKALMQVVISDLPEAARRFDAAKSVLQRQPTVDGEKIAAIGYCMGGTIVLEMARMGMELDGVVSYHGSLGTQRPAQPGKVKAIVCSRDIG